MLVSLTVPYFSKKAVTNNAGEKILGSLGTLHFGWFGGGIVKISYGLLGLGLTYLTASGVTVWLTRRRDKGRAAPGWERVWTAVVWGQPPALALAAGAATLIPGATVTSTLLAWGPVTVAALLAATCLSAAQLSRAGRYGTAALLIGLSIAHPLVRGGADPIAWTVDAGLLLAGLALLALRVRQSQAESKSRAEPS